MRERRQRLQRKHSDKTVPHGNDNEKDSAADQTLVVEISRTHNRQHTVENENADKNTEEQLQIKSVSLLTSVEKTVIEISMEKM